MKKLLIASNNPGKIREIKEILKGIPFEIKSLKDVDFKDDILETGKTFEENAVSKAETVGEKTGLITLADDSGLEVDALSGQPGIHSARYVQGSDKDRVNKLLGELKGIPKEKRTARFRAVVALYVPLSASNSIMSSLRKQGSRREEISRILTFEGISQGYITDKPIGKNGFGYDPVFFNLDLGKTNGEASPAEKNHVSHRARALFRLKGFLRKQH